MGREEAGPSNARGSRSCPTLGAGPSARRAGCLGVLSPSRGRESRSWDSGPEGPFRKGYLVRLSVCVTLRAEDTGLSCLYLEPF